MFRASEAIVSTQGRSYGTVRCWLDLSPTYLEARELKVVNKAKAQLGHTRSHHLSGRLLAKLPFGFWTSLCERPYEHGNLQGPRLWPKILPEVFPNIPRQFKYRQAIATRLNEIRDFRNRIAHHEPIWDRNLLVKNSEILETIGWMHPTMQKAVQACQEPLLLFHGGPAQYRALATTLLGAEL
jgi:hypothetical protein